MAHTPCAHFSGASYGPLYFGNFVQSVVFLTSFRVVMTIAYAQTSSVFLGALLHFTLTFSTIVIAPATTPQQLMIWNALWVLALAGVAVVWVQRQVRTRRPPVGTQTLRAR